MLRRWLGNWRSWVLDYGYAAYWQARAATSRIAPEPLLEGAKSPVVVVPGVYETWRFMQPLVMWVHSHGHPVHVLDFAGLNTRPVIESAEQVAAYLVAHDLRDVTLVAHSKGGLIGKYAMSTDSGAERVRFMLAVAAPFNGSVYARFLPMPSLRMFSPSNTTIVALAEQLEINSRIVSVYGRFDPHIPGGSHLPGAKNVELDAGGHFRVLADPRVLGELAVLLDSPALAPDADRPVPEDD